MTGVQTCALPIFAFRDGPRLEYPSKFLDPGANCGSWVSSRTGFFLGEINAVHPFRDGNGRTQREFIRQLAVRNGYPLNWQGVTREQMGAASKLSFQKGDNTGLADLIQLAIQT